MVWTAIALHTTPEVPYKMAPVIAATTVGVETDVLGMRLDCLTQDQIDAVTAVHPRPNFKNEILQAFTEGFQDRPETTFGTVNADVLEHFRTWFSPHRLRRRDQELGLARVAGYPELARIHRWPRRCRSPWSS